MKTVHVAFRHRPDDIRIFYKECRSLVQAGYDVTYITSNRFADQPEGNYDGVHVKLIPVIHARRIKRFMRYCRDLRKELKLQDANVYHFHETTLLPVLAYMKRRGKKVIYDMHENSPLNEEATFRKFCGNFLGRILYQFYKRYVNRWIAKSDYVICVTPSIEERCKKLTSNVSVVTNYPILNDLSDENMSYKKCKNQLCYTGGITERNGIIKIIEAMDKVNGTLVLAGDIEDDLENKLKDYPGWNKVQKLGFINRSEVERVMAESMVGLVLYQPSSNTSDSMPNKMFEYMEAGLPVIASNFPSWIGFIEGNDCGICVDPSNSSEIADAINDLLNDSQKAERMGENGKKLVYTELNWGGTEQETDSNLSHNRIGKICYCGGLSDDRNIPMYVKMMEQIDGILFLAGPIDKAYKEKLENYAGWEKVRYLGYLNHQEINVLYQSCDIGLCVLKNTPNYFESCPNKMFEYMEAGLPVVCSDFPAWEEVVIGNKCGICVPFADIDKVAAAVNKLLGDESLRREMGKNGKKAVCQKFNWEVEAKKLVKIYEEVL